MPDFRSATGELLQNAGCFSQPRTPVGKKCSKPSGVTLNHCKNYDTQSQWTASDGKDRSTTQRCCQSTFTTPQIYRRFEPLPWTYDPGPWSFQCPRLRTSKATCVKFALTQTSNLRLIIKDPILIQPPSREMSGEDTLISDQWTHLPRISHPRAPQPRIRHSILDLEI